MLPFDPLGTLPYALLRLIYPSQALSPSRTPPRSPSPSLPPLPEPTAERSRIVSEAEKLREKMRKEMLSELGGEDDEDVKFGISKKDDDGEATSLSKAKEEGAKDYEGVDWQAQVSGTKRVLSMEVSYDVERL